MKRLLLVSYPFPPNSSAGAVRSERFARYLSGLDWDVEVISIRPRKDLYADTRRLEILGQKVRIHMTRTIDPWLWLSDKNPGNRFLRAVRSALMEIFSFPDHMLLWVPFAVSKGLSIFKERGFDAIYTTSPPHSTHLAGLILSKLTGKTWVCDFRDPWTLNAYRDKGGWRRYGLIIERALEKQVIENAALVLSNTHANHKNLLKAFPKLDPEKVTYVPNGWEEFDCRKNIRFDPKKIVIVHAGTFYPKFNPYALFYALSAWKSGKYNSDVPSLSPDDIQIILLGSRDVQTANIVKKLNLSEIVDIRPWAAFDEARSIMCSADILWTSLGTGEESATYVPSKIFEYIAAKRPILGFFPKGEAQQIIEESGAGKVFSSDEPAPIIEYIRFLINLKKAGKIDSIYQPCQVRMKELEISTIIKNFSNQLIGCI